MIDDEYKTFRVNITGQLITVETVKMIALVGLLERVWQWLKGL